MKLNALFAGGAVLVLAFAPAASGQEAVDAAQYLEKLTELAGKSYECDMDMNMGLESPMPMSMALNGHMVYGDPSHMRVNMDMTMNMPMAEEPISMTMFMVLDGETMWMDMTMDMSAMGSEQRQVMKLPASRLAEMSQMGAMGMGPMGMGASDMDPVAQARKFLAIYEDMQATKTGDLVTLTGKVDMDKVGEMFGGASMPFELSSVTMVIDEKIGFPVTMTMSDDESTIMKMNFRNVKFHEEIPAENFRFVVPEGAQVIDLSAFLPATGARTEDEDF